MPRLLTPRERAALTALLEADFPGAPRLRGQAESVMAEGQGWSVNSSPIRNGLGPTPVTRAVSAGRRRRSDDGGIPSSTSKANVWTGGLVGD